MNTQRRWLAILMAIAIIATACGGGSADEGAGASDSGDAVADDDDDPCLVGPLGASSAWLLTPVFALSPPQQPPLLLVLPLLTPTCVAFMF